MNDNQEILKLIGICLIPAVLKFSSTRTDSTQYEKFVLPISILKEYIRGVHSTDLIVKKGCFGLDRSATYAILKTVGMAYHETEVHRRAFETSHTTMLIYHAGQLIDGQLITIGTNSRNAKNRNYTLKSFL